MHFYIIKPETKNVILFTVTLKTTLRNGEWWHTPLI